MRRNHARNDCTQSPHVHTHIHEHTVPGMERSRRDVIGRDTSAWSSCSPNRLPDRVAVRFPVPSHPRSNDHHGCRRYPRMSRVPHPHTGPPTPEQRGVVNLRCRITSPTSCDHPAQTNTHPAGTTRWVSGPVLAESGLTQTPRRWCDRGGPGRPAPVTARCGHDRRSPRNQRFGGGIRWLDATARVDNRGPAPTVNVAIPQQDPEIHEDPTAVTGVTGKARLHVPAGMCAGYRRGRSGARVYHPRRTPRQTSTRVTGRRR